MLLFFLIYLINIFLTNQREDWNMEFQNYHSESKAPTFLKKKVMGSYNVVKDFFTVIDLFIGRIGTVLAGFLRAFFPTPSIAR